MSIQPFICLGAETINDPAPTPKGEASERAAFDELEKKWLRRLERLEQTVSDNPADDYTSGMCNQLVKCIDELHASMLADSRAFGPIDGDKLP